ncbi:methionine--tRNA ligase [Candidatus Woesearchaeota archaeon]|nr:methionine--tRNA ligase [Candidatus Woesearchaeota archaeon]
MKSHAHEKKHTERILITAALPYANGSIHLGHMVEYIQADIYSRAMKLFGKHAVFVCADDTHGAPIEIKATSLGMKPEQLIDKYYKEHTKDFADFGVLFDSYYSTNSPENKTYSDFIFTKLKEAGHIYTKEIPVIYCEHCKRFLPDRYVKGTCPKCHAPDQYGDVCEKCSSTHKTTDLINPKCATCGKTPVPKTSEHYFFKLSVYEDKLRHFFKTADVQPEIVNSVSNWLGELQDWCISRDGPYFGFKIPGEENKYYYVWLDAPVGYIASTAHYCKTSGEKVADYWNTKDTKVIHFIGKDIIYFHFLFWPSMLMTAGFQLPSKIMVHGFLTVNKEKMSKSRGTFITARHYLDHLNPEYLRFYYAAHLSPTVTDLDLDLAQFKERVNSELIGNIANFCYRVLSFAAKNFDGKVGSFHEPAVADEIIALRELTSTVKMNYEQMNFKDALSGILAFSSVGNKYFQQNEPWKLIKEDASKTKDIISFCTLLIKDLSILLAPILPTFSSALQKQLGVSSLTWNDLSFVPEDFVLSDVVPLIQKIEEEHKALIVQEPTKREEKKQEKKEFPKTEAQGFPLLLKVGKILSVEEHPNAEKLYVETIDLGDGDVRTIVSGIRSWYKKEDLVGKHVIVVANLKPAKLRGVMSAGMILAAEHDGKLEVLEAPKSAAGDLAFFGSETSAPQQIQYNDFAKLSILVSHKTVVCDGKKLQTHKETIHCSLPDGVKVE